MTQAPEQPQPLPLDTWVGDHDPADQNWLEHGDEIRLAAQRAGRERQQPETD
ncbi:hypothetical protein [Amycolatopsis benzoatilytica]|uniref:hypothetical protein n=1 Tax=Amycolatopsis benzoatilytica TaxID=346045 RepID=UPI000368B1B2|nr:hypothetical protein [Amycolatopsis benzoatilytica]